MARLSTSSSATSTGNGHATLPRPAQPRRPIREYNNKDDSDIDSPHFESPTMPFPPDPTLLPNGTRSLSLIGLQAFILGLTLSTSLLSTTYLALGGNTLWRLPAFFACLSLFHFLEYWTTAHFNTPVTQADSFLLYNNGRAYNIAHGLATLEILLTHYLSSYPAVYINPLTITLGILLILIGQSTRTTAMAQAGTNFNHKPQKVRRAGHELVTGGVYARLRHPSYFGFFWWALGTQVLVGNKACLVGYAGVLWYFFARRVRIEEKSLVGFFGEEYESYRRRTWTGIPFIR